jgi:hypothetical protein
MDAINYMSNIQAANLDSRHFLASEVMPKGFTYPQAYLDFIILNGSKSVAMLGMPPWIFAGDETWVKDESIRNFGTLLVPFSQAEQMDMMACFEASGEKDPKIWVVNPWEQLPENRIYNVLNNFDEWLIFAKKTSKDFLIEKPYFYEREFWFPK